jgi:hypothetical protein
MTIWDAANEIEQMSYKLSNVRDAIELVAGDVSDPHSGALWAIHSMIDDIQNKMYIQVEQVMELHRAELKLKKAKK